MGRNRGTGGRLSALSDVWSKAVVGRMEERRDFRGVLRKDKSDLEISGGGRAEGRRIKNESCVWVGTGEWDSRRTAGLGVGAPPGKRRGEGLRKGNLVVQEPR